MKQGVWLLAGVVLAVVVGLAGGVRVTAGDLDPPGAIGTTMVPLDSIYAQGQFQAWGGGSAVWGPGYIEGAPGGAGVFLAASNSISVLQFDTAYLTVQSTGDCPITVGNIAGVIVDNVVPARSSMAFRVYNAAVPTFEFGPGTSCSMIWVVRGFPE
jgi:hypothetical protein